MRIWFYIRSNWRNIFRILITSKVWSKWCLKNIKNDIFDKDSEQREEKNSSETLQFLAVIEEGYQLVMQEKIILRKHFNSWENLFK